ncbi:MAG TPA: hypothetical protein P5525_11145 [Candidatus Paceibacterota bacterium]|nr:hypothetical protein [Candidatus Paceibacterota bacterium]
MSGNKSQEVARLQEFIARVVIAGEQWHVIAVLFIAAEVVTAALLGIAVAMLLKAGLL